MNEMQKKTYRAPSLDVVAMTEVDILTTSGLETPILGEEDYTQ